jgi:hypothetical protein
VTAVRFDGCTPPEPSDPQKQGSCAGASGLGPSVDPNRSFTFGPGAAGAPADIFYLDLQGQDGPDQLLCAAGQSKVLGPLELDDLPAGSAPALTQEGLDVFTLELLVTEDPNQPVERQNIQLRSASFAVDPNAPDILLEVRPAPNPDGGRRWEITLTAEVEIHRLVFGLIGPENIAPDGMSFVGCTDTPPGPGNHRSCLDANPNNPDVNADAIDFSDPNTFTLGPDPGASSPALLVRTLYVSLVGAHERGFNAPSLNRPEIEQKVRLGILEFAQPLVLLEPELTKDGIGLLPGAPPVVKLSDGSIVSADAVGTNVRGDSDDDNDSDTIGAETDNCPHAPNPSQVDGGGVMTTDPDGVGDACQCGEGNGDGPVYPEDVRALQEVVAGLPGDPGAPDRCSVAGTVECDILDVVIVGQVTASPPGNSFSQACPAANP